MDVLGSVTTARRLSVTEDIKICLEEGILYNQLRRVPLPRALNVQSHERMMLGD